MDSSYWQLQLQLHHQFFDQIYLHQDFSSLDQSQIKMQITQFEMPYSVQLKCSDVARIKEILGDSWKFGIPFNYKLSDACDTTPSLNASQGAVIVPATDPTTATHGTVVAPPAQVTNTAIPNQSPPNFQIDPTTLKLLRDAFGTDGSHPDLDAFPSLLGPDPKN
jgi:hypothetical protein